MCTERSQLAKSPLLHPQPISILEIQSLRLYYDYNNKELMEHFQ